MMADDFNLAKELSKIKDPESLEVIERIVSYFNSRIQALEAKVAELSRDSNTSSKPPSSDITKPRSERRKRGKRKIGGQKGSERKFKKRFSEVDEVCELEINICPDCNNENLGSLSESEVKIDQNAELPESPIEVTEYRRKGKYCDCCNKVIYPELPEGVIEGQLFGPRLQSLIAYMKGNLGNSYSELERYCGEVLGIMISQGMLAKIVSRVSESIKEPYLSLKNKVSEESSLNIDETGWKDNGERYWIWVFCNSMIAFFTISKSRGSKVLKEVLGEVFSGAIISDFYSAYTAYANPKQQFCLAHLIRDIKFLITLPDKAQQDFGKGVLKHFKAIFRLWHRRKKYPPEKFEKYADEIQRRLGTYLCQSGLTGKSLTMQKRLRKHFDNLFRFFTEPELYSPTNNHAERTIRHFVRIRKMTQGSRGETGQNWNARIMTVLETCRLQKRNPWEFINQSFQAHCFGGNYPSLLAT